MNLVGDRLRVLQVLRKAKPEAISADEISEALNGMRRPEARVCDLKQMGYRIETVMVKAPSGRRYGRYRLVAEPAITVVAPIEQRLKECQANLFGHAHNLAGSHYDQERRAA